QVLQNEVHPLAGIHLEQGLGAVIGQFQRGAGAQQQLAVLIQHPATVGLRFALRSAGTVAEARYQLHAHGHAAVQSFNAADDDRAVAHRHVIGQAHPAAVAVEFGTQYQGVGFVMALYVARLMFRRGLPEAMLFVAEQPAEAGGSVEAGWAEPVDTAIAASQRGAAQVADKGVVLDGLAHQLLRCRGVSASSSSTAWQQATPPPQRPERLCAWSPRAASCGLWLRCRSVHGCPCPAPPAGTGYPAAAATPAGRPAGLRSRRSPAHGRRWSGQTCRSRWS